jgi:hypothetical protein
MQYPLSDASPPPFAFEKFTQFEVYNGVLKEILLGVEWSIVVGEENLQCGCTLKTLSGTLITLHFAPINCGKRLNGLILIFYLFPKVKVMDI